LLKLLAGLLEPAGGVVVFAGRELAAWPPVELARRLAFMPQEVHFHFPSPSGNTCSWRATPTAAGRPSRIKTISPRRARP
jgi:iron complex transport system ATP-binding protein